MRNYPYTSDANKSNYVMLKEVCVLIYPKN